MAERSGGACELVSHHENMAERIHQHFKRIGTLSSDNNRIIWPVQPLKIFPTSMPTIFDGDTCNLFAWFAEPPAGDVTLQLSQPGSTDLTIAAGIVQDTNSTTQDNTIARMVAALRLREITNGDACEQLAVDYQLISNWTNYLAIVKRDEDEKADTLPELRKVQQMLAAGWGGMGTTLYSAPMISRVACNSKFITCVGIDTPTFLRDIQPRSPQSPKSSKADIDVVRETDYDGYGVSAPSVAWLWDHENQYTLGQLVELIDMFLSSGEVPAKMTLPLLPDSVSELLHTLVNEGFDEQVVVIVFLHCLNKSSAEDGFSRQARRVIEKAYKQLQVDQQTLLSLEERFKSDAG